MSESLILVLTGIQWNTSISCWYRKGYSWYNNVTEILAFCHTYLLCCYNTILYLLTTKTNVLKDKVLVTQNTSISHFSFTTVWQLTLTVIYGTDNAISLALYIQLQNIFFDTIHFKLIHLNHYFNINELHTYFLNYTIPTIIQTFFTQNYFFNTLPPWSTINKLTNK